MNRFHSAQAAEGTGTFCEGEWHEGIPCDSCSPEQKQSLGFLYNVFTGLCSSAEGGVSGSLEKKVQVKVWKNADFLLSMRSLHMQGEHAALLRWRLSFVGSILKQPPRLNRLRAFGRSSSPHLHEQISHPSRTQRCLSCFQVETVFPNPNKDGIWKEGLFSQIYALSSVYMGYLCFVGFPKAPFWVLSSGGFQSFPWLHP